MRLTGSELLSKVASLESEQLTEAAIARACGYVATTKDGKERVDVNRFHRAMLAAHGHEIVTGSLRPRAPRGYAVVSKTGQVTIGKTYLLEIGALTGQHLQVSKSGNALVLTPIAAPAEDQPPAIPQTAPMPALAA